MTGKEKCNFLKEIRKNIAEHNGIKYEPRECDEDVCNSGTCSLCEQEAEQLLSALREKEAAGSPIRIDVESIEGFGYLATEPFEYDGPDMPLSGVPARDTDEMSDPEEEEMEMGQVISPIDPLEYKE